MQKDFDRWNKICRICRRAPSVVLWIVFFLFLALPAPTHADTSTGLVGHWTLDGKDTPWTSPTAGTTKDRSGNGNTGTLTNMTRSVSTTLGKIGQALKFGGTGDLINAGTIASISGTNPTMTECAWVKTGTANNSYTMAYRNPGGGPAFYIQTGALIFYWGGGAYTSTAPASVVGRWVHICVTTTGGAVTFFENGKQYDTQSGNTIAAGIGYFSIGAWDAGATSAASTIDDVRVYNRALSASEVSKLYKQGASTSR